MIDWKLPAALLIGGLFVYLTNRKTEKKLKDHFERKLKEDHKQKATKRKDENIYEDR
jgi:hypothetical protein